MLLMDERRGRRIALQENITPVGLLGVLIASKKHGLLSQIQPIIEQLESEAGFRVAAKLKAQVLKIAGEQ